MDQLLRSNIKRGNFIKDEEATIINFDSIKRLVTNQSNYQTKLNRKKLSINLNKLIKFLLFN